jgi:DNA recombination-dependent growth factor C
MPDGLVIIIRREETILAATIIEDVIYNKRE